MNCVLDKDALLSVDFSPAVFKGTGAVEYKMALFAVGVSAKIAETLKLESVWRRNTVFGDGTLHIIGDTRLHLATLQNLK